MANRSPEKVKIGSWYSMCCILDLYEVENEDDLQSVRGYLQEAIDDPQEDVGMHTWDTLLEAVSEMQSWGENIDERPDLKNRLTQRPPDKGGRR